MRCTRFAGADHPGSILWTVVAGILQTHGVALTDAARTGPKEVNERVNLHADVRVDIR
jgi:hypothetical protein